MNTHGFVVRDTHEVGLERVRMGRCRRGVSDTGVDVNTVSTEESGILVVQRHYERKQKLR